jgi:hypothetical protein
VTAVGSRARDWDGFRVESPKGLVGWVEETWRGASSCSSMR